MVRGSERGGGDRQSPLRQANTALVRTEQRLSVGVQADLPPHNFNVRLLEFSAVVQSQSQLLIQFELD
jgi:hypothetical protein